MVLIGMDGIVVECKMCLLIWDFGFGVRLKLILCVGILLEEVWICEVLMEVLNCFNLFKMSCEMCGRNGW